MRPMIISVPSFNNAFAVLSFPPDNCNQDFLNKVARDVVPLLHSTLLWRAVTTTGYNHCALYWHLPLKHNLMPS